MKIYKAYKFRLYPTDEQRILIHKTFGCSRFVYNYYLNYQKENGVQKSFDLCKYLKFNIDNILNRIITIK